MKAPTPKTNKLNVPLKFIALLLGYTFWYIFGSSHTTTAQLTVPLCFYNIPELHRIHAPELISIQIAGKRSAIRALDTDALAVHINAETVHEGKNLLAITQESLLLPESIKLVHYSPSNPTVELLSTVKVQET